MIEQGGHYVRRFFTSLSRRPPDPVDDAWVRATVTATEWPLYARLGNQDRRHSAFSGRELVRILGPDVDPELVGWIGVAIGLLASYRHAIQGDDGLTDTARVMRALLDLLPPEDR